ncbi:hypothetical protein LC2W_2410 [Lacticaseibacillus paracasei]|nr:hypothetical protein LC2W_2410 [Lacticaseibacillus paracasei]
MSLWYQFYSLFYALGFPLLRVGSAAIQGGDREARVVGTALNPQNARFQSLALV